MTFDPKLDADPVDGYIAPYKGADGSICHPVHRWTRDMNNVANGIPPVEPISPYSQEQVLWVTNRARQEVRG